MNIDKDTIEHVAKLARLNLEEDEKIKYAEELSVIFDYIEELNKLDTENIKETFQVLNLENIVREDEVKKYDQEKRDKIILNFPEKKEELLKVKAVFENNEE
jgi:aspartyl-tRNA(Asn)/glutamyl-tRNA(Gln) amidotransferase subunit C